MPPLASPSSAVFSPRTTSPAEVHPYEDPTTWPVTRVVAAVKAVTNGDIGITCNLTENDIDGSVLLALTDEELKTDLNIKSLGMRKRIRALIDNLKQRGASVGRAESEPVSKPGVEMARSPSFPLQTKADGSAGVNRSGEGLAIVDIDPNLPLVPMSTAEEISMNANKRLKLDLPEVNISGSRLFGRFRQQSGGPPEQQAESAPVAQMAPPSAPTVSPIAPGLSNLNNKPVTGKEGEIPLFLRDISDVVIDSPKKRKDRRADENPRPSVRRKDTESNKQEEWPGPADSPTNPVPGWSAVNSTVHEQIAKKSLPQKTRAGAHSSSKPKIKIHEQKGMTPLHAKPESQSGAFKNKSSSSAPLISNPMPQPSSKRTLAPVKTDSTSSTSASKSSKPRRTSIDADARLAKQLASVSNAAESVKNRSNARTPQRRNPAEFVPGKIWMAHMKSYPPWPAMILPEELLSTQLQSTAPKDGKWEHWFPVLWLATWEYRSFDPFASTDYRSRDLNAVGENGWLAYPYPRGSSWMHMDEMRPVTTALLYPKDSSWSNFDKFVQARTQVEKGFGLEDAKKMKREKVIVRAEFLATDPHIEVQQPETWSKEKKKWFLTHRKDRLRDAFWEKSGRRIKGSPVYDDMIWINNCLLSLEEWPGLDKEQELIDKTKIDMVIEGMSRLDDIPLDDYFHFRERCIELWREWRAGRIDYMSRVEVPIKKDDPKGGRWQNEYPAYDNRGRRIHAWREDFPKFEDSEDDENWNMVVTDGR